jgi:hypothetical protein
MDVSSRKKDKEVQSNQMQRTIRFELTMTSMRMIRN